MLTSILLQAAQQQGMGIETLLMFGAIIVVFYFFMIRPQQKKQKELKKQRDAMTKGSNVVTAGGIYGKIVEVDETTFLIAVDGNVKLRVDKNSVYPSAADAQEAQQQKK